MNLNVAAGEADFDVCGFAVDDDGVVGAGDFAGAPVTGVVPVAVTVGNPGHPGLLVEVKAGERDRHRRGDRVAGQVGEDRSIERELIPALAQRLCGVDHHSPRRRSFNLGHGDGRVIAAAGAGVGAEVRQGDSAHSESAGVDRFVEPQGHGVDAEASSIESRAGANEQRRRDVAGQVVGQRVGQAGVSAGVGGSHLEGHRGGSAGQRGHDRAQIERSRHVIDHDLTVHQQLDVANLHIVGHGDADRHNAPFLEIDSRRPRNRGRGCLTLIVERSVVDHLQAGRASGDERDAGSDGHALRRGRQSELGDETIRVRGV